MKKISRYLILIIAIGTLLSSFWVYQKYFEQEGEKLLFFKVERGVIKEIVRVRGEVVSQKEFDLEFPFSGIIERVFVKEGQVVNKGALLMKLDTADYELEIGRLRSVLSQRQSNLDKLIAGATEEDINISKTKVANAKISFGEAKKNLMDKLNDSYTKSDDAVRVKTDQFFSNPRTSNPTLGFTVSDSGLKTDVEWERFLIEGVFDSWQSSLDSLSISDNLDLYISDAKKNLSRIKSFLSKTALALNGARLSAGVSQATIDAWKVDVSSARSNVNAAVSALSAAEEKLRTAESNLALAEDELALKTAGARIEDVKIAESKISEVENQIAAVLEKIRKSNLYAPAAVEVVKIHLEEGELFRPGNIALSLSSAGFKIQADVSELEIGKVQSVNGDNVLIKLDAFPGLELKGGVAYIEPKEIIKDGDKYYRVNVFFQQDGEKIRSGMSADLDIIISSKENVLKIPELVVYQKDDKNFVKLFKDRVISEVEIETGISDGEFIEAVKGLSEGQTVIVSAD